MRDTILNLKETITILKEKEKENAEMISRLDRENTDLTQRAVSDKKLDSSLREQVGDLEK